MGWDDYHLHEFEIINPSTLEKESIGIPDEEFGDKEVLPGKKQRIADWFSMQNSVANYVYDFGDNWEHKVKLENILPRDKNINYPICIDGKRACPPEDCGGIWGYEEFLEVIKNPKHKEHKQMLEWIGGEFDPEYFNVNEIVFRGTINRQKI